MVSEGGDNSKLFASTVGNRITNELPLEPVLPTCLTPETEWQDYLRNEKVFFSRFGESLVLM